MFSDPVITNPFVADGIIPESHGCRTVVEFRARLFSVAPTFSPLDVNNSNNPDQMDIITPSGLPITPASMSANLNGRATPATPPTPNDSTSTSLNRNNLTDSQPVISPIAPDIREGERVLHVLGNSVDLTTIGPLHPTFFAIMRVAPPAYLRRSAISLHLQRRYQQSFNFQIFKNPNDNDTNNANNNNNTVLTSTTNSTLTNTMIILMRTLKTARSMLFNIINKSTSTSLYTINRILGSNYFDGIDLNRQVEPNLLSWHWADDLLAISTGSNFDRICAFHFQSNEFEISGDRHQNLNHVRCISFRPYAGRILALGGQYGIFLLDRQNLYALNPNQLDNSHNNICSLDWSPDGQWLATASADNGSVRIWDIATRTSRTLPYSGCYVKFNPIADSHLLFVSDASGSNFRLWNLRLWKAERWGSLSGPVISAVWNRDGSTLLFSTQNASCIHILTLSRPHHDQQHNFSNHINKSNLLNNTTIKGAETSITKVEMTVLPREGPGGTPILMELDPTSERLAIVYEVPEEESPDIETNPCVKGDPHRRFSVALYSTQFIPSFVMTPIGYINGPENAGPPAAIKFKPQPVGSAGATLACMWRSGQITFTHLFFNPSRRSRV